MQWFLRDEISRTEHPTAILTPALLRFCRKRIYPSYVYVRTKDIFTSREMLIAYEEALRMEAAVDALLEGEADEDLVSEEMDVWAAQRGREASIQPPLRAKSSSSTHSSRGKENIHAQSRSGSQPRSLRASVSLGEADEVAERAASEAPKESKTVLNARRILKVFERVYPRWRELLKAANAREVRSNGLQRFDEGWILTRIIYKGVLTFSSSSVA